MFFSKDSLSDAEKIDRVYSMLRAERNGRRFWLFVKLAVFGSIVYGIHYLSLPENAETRDAISATIETKTKAMILPMVGSMVQDMTESLWQPEISNSVTSSGGKVIHRNINRSSPIEITPEMIKAVEDSIPKN